MLKAHSSDAVAAVIFIRAERSGGVVLDSQGLRHAPIGPDDWRMIEANLLLFEAAQLIKDPLAAQYLRQAAQDRLREQAAKLLEPGCPD